MLGARLLISSLISVPSFAATHGIQSVFSTHALIMGLPCDEILSSTTFSIVSDSVERTPESKRIARALVRGAEMQRLWHQAQLQPVQPNTVQRRVIDIPFGVALIKSWQYLEESEIIQSNEYDPPWINGRYPQDEILGALRRKVEQVAAGIRTKDEMVEVAEVIAALLVRAMGDSAAARAEMITLARRIGTDYDQDGAQARIRLVLEDFNRKFNFSRGAPIPIPAAVIRRLGDPEVRRFLAPGLNFLSRLFSRVRTEEIADPAHHHSRLRDLGALRLRNDFRLLMMDGGNVDAVALQRVRPLISRAVPQLTLRQREALVAEYGTSPDFRVVITEAMKEIDLDDADAESQKGAGSLRQKELLYYLAFMHPDFASDMSEAYRLQDEALRQSVSAKLQSPIEEDLERVLRTGLFIDANYRAWLTYVRLNDWSRAFPHEPVALIR